MYHNDETPDGKLFARIIVILASRIQLKNASEDNTLNVHLNMQLSGVFLHRRQAFLTLAAN